MDDVAQMLDRVCGVSKLQNMLPFRLLDGSSANKSCFGNNACTGSGALSLLLYNTLPQLKENIPLQTRASICFKHMVLYLMLAIFE